MPNRIIKESICTSENIDQLSAFNETVFYRLIVNVDDYGRIDARPKLLAAKLFPLKDIRAAQIEEALRKLTSAELVTIYFVDGKPFLQMNTWDRHQTIRAKRSKCPPPESGVQADENICKQMQADENICKQMQADASRCSRNPIQSESVSESESEDSAEQSSAPVAELPLVDGTIYGITSGEYLKDCEAYPAVDVLAEYRKMGRWLDSNPKNRKTRQGIRRFVNSWLAREQDHARPQKQEAKGYSNPFYEALQRGEFDDAG